jgi:lysyl endopeptidase
MNSRLFRLVTIARLAAAAAAFVAGSVTAQMPVVLGEPALAAKTVAPAPRLRIQEKATADKRVLRTQTQLAPVAETELASVRARNQQQGIAKREAIGVVRTAADGLPSAGDLMWVSVEGGRAAQAAVTSPNAAALRLAIDLAGVPTNVEMVFFGSGDSRLVGPLRVADIADRSVAWWGPLTEGDTQTVEFFVPGGTDARALPLRIAAVSHLFAGPSTKFQKELEDIGRAGSCNVDIACSGLTSSPGFLPMKDAVAQMVLNDGVFSYLCTGTLLNDSDPTSQIPWFYTANHCFDNEEPPYRTPAQLQTVANTVATIWFFEANACRSNVVSSAWVQVNGGATYVYSTVTSDVMFVRLRNPAPPGAFFAGWDANPMVTGTQVISVHHPQGDLKKVSQGAMLGFSTPGVGGGSNQFIQVRWSSGTTEGGSSGAGVFTSNGAQYLLRGGLFGGTALCSVPNGTDNFSRFDQAYPALAAYLGAAFIPNVDYTDLWWGGESESGWGLTMSHHPSGKIFVVWYTYAADTKRTWFVMSDGTWTSPNTYTGPLYAPSGPGYNAVPWDASRVRVTPVGTGTLTFTDSGNGTWAYSVNGIAGTKAITRLPY